MSHTATHYTYQDELLTRHLQEFINDTDPDIIAKLREHLQWLEISGGETLMTQGDAGDSMYLLLSGRLRAYIGDESGRQHMVGEIARGQVIGEMSMYTDEPRSATVVAIRDSVLVRLPKSEFHTLIGADPRISVAMTRQIIARLKSKIKDVRPAVPTTIGLLPITTGVDLQAFSAQLAAHLLDKGRVCVVDSALIDRKLLAAGIANRNDDDIDVNRRIAILLDEIEATHDFVLLLSDHALTPWSRRCARHCDEILLLADAGAPPQLHPIEIDYLMQRAPQTIVAQVLVLLHPPQTPTPRHTARWLARRDIAGHVHVRVGLQRDMARLARIQSRTAVGLVLAGGGARGFAHLGVYQALKRRGIEIDYFGGTSIGAVMATLLASDQPVEKVMGIARRAFLSNPTGDFSMLPLLSLIKGRRLQGIIVNAVRDLLDFDADIEDLWKNTYFVATNYSKAAEHVSSSGHLSSAIRASIAIPGALPPLIHDGDLLCDGGTFNNFPVDVMRRMRGVGKVIGIDLKSSTPSRIELQEMPSNWALLRDRLRARGKRRYRRLPSLATYLMNVTILYSTSRQNQASKDVDLYFNPPLDRVGMLAWKRFDQIVQLGVDHGDEVLAGLQAQELARFQDRAVAAFTS
jgi:NTE family protein